MTGSSLIISAHVAVQNTASQIAGYRICVGKRAGDRGIRRFGSFRVGPAIGAKKLPAIIVIRCQFRREAGSVNAAAALALPMTDRARNVAVDFFRSVFAALVQCSKQACSSFRVGFQVLLSADPFGLVALSDTHRDSERKLQCVTRSLQGTPKCL